MNGSIPSLWTNARSISSDFLSPSVMALSQMRREVWEALGRRWLTGTLENWTIII